MSTQRAQATYKTHDTLPPLEKLLGGSPVPTGAATQAVPVTYAAKDIAKARSVLDRLLAEAESAEVSYSREVPKQVTI